MATATLLSVNEYLRLPCSNEGSKDELINGEIVLSPTAQTLHVRVVRRITKLVEAIEGLGYEIGTDVGCRLGEYSLPSADLAATRVERLQKVGAIGYLVGAPELVVEVFSPSNRKGLMAQKVALYLEHGAEAVWVVYPKRRTVMVHEGDSQKEARCGETVSFQALVVPVSAIFEGL
jgi:Uma2 family endonuclease